MRFRRIIQGMSFLAFLVLLVLASTPLADTMRADLFLRMDPLVFLVVLIAGRAFVILLLPALVVMALTLVFGRFFCSILCPMGTTIDIFDRIVQRPRRRFAQKGSKTGFRSLGIVKYVMLSCILGASIAGVSFVFLASPLSLATRLYGLAFFPALARPLDIGITGIREAGRIIGVPVFEYTSVSAQAFVLQWFTLITAVLILGSGIVTRRFWCRYLCPAGAILAVLSMRPYLKRHVSDSCTRCGVCRRMCPMDAVGKDPVNTRSGDCIACGRCARECPVGAVRFSAVGSRPNGRESPFSKHRRGLMISGLGGLGAALVCLSLPEVLRGKTSGGAGSSLIRPPGALPEDDFLARCIRCGECMKACPTNTLQHTGLSSGLAGFMSPVITPRRGPCEPSCTRCGSVCPTGAVRALSHEEKIWAKVGTASVIRKKCLAWEFGRACLVCDEVCPFGAIDLKRVKESRVAVPFVNEKRCNGCGFCENACPVPSESAIVIGPKGAFRMEKGSYIRAGRDSGFVFEVKGKSSYPEDAGGESVTGKLPPGFDE